MRIGMISQWYEPEPGAAGHPTAVARALKRRGGELRVLTGFPSYPAGRVFDGYQMRPWRSETRDGIQLRRVPDVPSHDSSALRRSMSLVSFAASATTQVAWLRGSDVCLVYLSPATVGAAAWLLRRVWRVPYVLYVQDLWPESVSASGFIGNERAIRGVESGLHRLLRGLYRGADSIAAISPSMASTLESRGGAGKTHVVPNWIDESVFNPNAGSGAGRLRELDRDSVWIMYAGGIGDVQGLESAVRAIAILAQRPDLKLALVGEGVARPSLQRLVSDLGVEERVRFLGARPMASMPALMRQADAQLVSLRDLPLFRGTIPSKLQSSMALGLPVICSVPGDAAVIVNRASCGLAVPPDDSHSLAQAFLAMADAGSAGRMEMGRRAAKFHEEYLSEERGAGLLFDLLSRAAGARA
jgi:colanic acid biosynthesis glycosyl transferase WcaI